MDLLHADLDLARLLLRGALAADDHGLGLVVNAHVIARAQGRHVLVGDGQLATVKGNRTAQLLADVVDDIAQILLFQRLVKLAGAGRLC